MSFHQPGHTADMPHLAVAFEISFHATAADYASSIYQADCVISDLAGFRPTLACRRHEEPMPSRLLPRCFDAPALCPLPAQFASSAGGRYALQRRAYFAPAHAASAAADAPVIKARCLFSPAR